MGFKGMNLKVGVFDDIFCQNDIYIVNLGLQMTYQ